MGRVAEMKLPLPPTIQVVSHALMLVEGIRHGPQVYKDTHSGKDTHCPASRSSNPIAAILAT